MRVIGCPVTPSTSAFAMALRSRASAAAAMRIRTASSRAATLRRTIRWRSGSRVPASRSSGLDSSSSAIRRRTSSAKGPGRLRNRPSPGCGMARSPSCDVCVSTSPRFISSRPIRWGLSPPRSAVRSRVTKSKRGWSDDGRMASRWSGSRKPIGSLFRRREPCRSRDQSLRLRGRCPGRARAGGGRPVGDRGCARRRQRRTLPAFRAHPQGQSAGQAHRSGTVVPLSHAAPRHSVRAAVSAGGAGRCGPRAAVHRVSARSAAVPDGLDHVDEQRGGARRLRSRSAGRPEPRRTHGGAARLGRTAGHARCARDSAWITPTGGGFFFSPAVSVFATLA